MTDNIGNFRFHWVIWDSFKSTEKFTSIDEKKILLYILDGNRKITDNSENFLFRWVISDLFKSPEKSTSSEDKKFFL